MKAPTFTDLAVVGMHFREKEGVQAKSIVANFVPPVTLQYEREPNNPFDGNALKVIYQNQHIGYIEAASACFLSPWIDEGHEYTLTVTELQSRRNNLHPIVTATPTESASLETKASESVDV